MKKHVVRGLIAALVIAGPAASEARAQAGSLSGVEGSIYGGYGFADAYRWGIGATLGYMFPLEGGKSVFAGLTGAVHLGDTYASTEDICNLR